MPWLSPTGGALWLLLRDALWLPVLPAQSSQRPSLLQRQSLLPSVWHLTETQRDRHRGLRLSEAACEADSARANRGALLRLASVAALTRKTRPGTVASVKSARPTAGAFRLLKKRSVSLMVILCPFLLGVCTQVLTGYSKLVRNGERFVECRHVPASR
jgi:hypothetical protein